MLKEKDKIDYDLLEKLKNIRIERGATKSEQLIAQKKIDKILQKETSVKTNNKTFNKVNTKVSINGANKNNNKYETKSYIKDKTDNTLQNDTHGNTRNYFVCPHCGSDMFYDGASGGSSTNILCANCFSEFNTIPGIGVLGEIYGLDLEGLKVAYCISPKKVKRQNPEAYNRIVNNSSLWQKIIYKFK